MVKIAKKLVGGSSYVNQHLTTDLKRVFLSDKTADVHFVFVDNDQIVRVPAHKILLAARSEVFETMFYGKMKETDNIQIVDASVAAFKEFLQFFYRNIIKLTMDCISDVVNLCKKYHIDDCLNICEDFLMDSLTIGNICFAYGLAILFDLDGLKALCKDEIDNNPRHIFQTTQFLNCHRSVLGHILISDSLSCTEIEMFDACMAWVKAVSNQNELTRQTIQEYLGDLFYEIRFGSMSIIEFASLTSTYANLFTLDEYQDIVQTIALTNFESKKFNSRVRQLIIRNTSLSSDESYKSSPAVNEINIQRGLNKSKSPKTPNISR